MKIENREEKREQGEGYRAQRLGGSLVVDARRTPHLVGHFAPGLIGLLHFRQLVFVQAMQFLPCNVLHGLQTRLSS